MELIRIKCTGAMGHDFHQPRPYICVQTSSGMTRNPFKRVSLEPKRNVLSRTEEDIEIGTHASTRHNCRKCRVIGCSLRMAVSFSKVFAICDHHDLCATNVQPVLISLCSVNAHLRVYHQRCFHLQACSLAK